MPRYCVSVRPTGAVEFWVDAEDEEAACKQALTAFAMNYCMTGNLNAEVVDVRPCKPKQRKLTELLE